MQDNKHKQNRKTKDTRQKRDFYIYLKSTLDQTLQECSENTTKKKKKKS